MSNTIPPVVRRASMAASILYQLAKEKLGDAAIHYLQFPRNIETLISHTFYLPIRSIPHLTLYAAGQYLCIQSNGQDKDRQLYGLLHIGPPAITIFVEEQLSPRVRNYVIAHELGHYIHDIFMVQRLWSSSLQAQKAAISQAFTWQSYDPLLDLEVFVKGLPERPRTITMRGQAMRQETRTRELFANAIAIELLAPWHEAVTLFYSLRANEWKKRLHEEYGVPSKIVSSYYEDVQRCLTPEPDLFGQLFTSPHPRDVV
jgi:hypothetical protein